MSDIRKEAKDEGAAAEKIRRLQVELGLPPADKLKTPDDLHNAIRELEKKASEATPTEGV